MSSREAQPTNRTHSGGTVHTQTTNPALIGLLRENSAANQNRSQTDVPSAQSPASPAGSSSQRPQNPGDSVERPAPGVSSSSVPAVSETDRPLQEGGGADTRSSRPSVKHSSADPAPGPPPVPDPQPAPVARSISQTIIRDDHPEGNRPGERSVNPSVPATPISHFVPSETDSASSELARLVGSPSRKSFVLSAAISEAGTYEEEEDNEYGDYWDRTVDSPDVTNEQIGAPADRPISGGESGGHTSAAPGLRAPAAGAPSVGGSKSLTSPAAHAHGVGPAAPSPDLNNPGHQRFVTSYVSRRLKDQPVGRSSAVSTALHERSGTGTALNVPRDQSWSTKQVARLRTGGAEDPEPPAPQRETTPDSQVSTPRSEEDPDLVDSLDLTADRDDHNARQSPPPSITAVPVPLEQGVGDLPTPESPEQASRQSGLSGQADPAPQPRSGSNSTVVTPGGREAAPSLPLAVEGGRASPSSSRRATASILKKPKEERAESTLRRVYVDSPTFTREEEEEYRFVSSRVDNYDEEPAPTHPTFRGLDRQALSHVNNGAAVVASRSNSRPFKQVHYQVNQDTDRYEDRDEVLQTAEPPRPAPTQQSQFVLKAKSGSAESSRAPPPVKSLALPAGPSYDPVEEEELEKEKTYQQELRNRVDSLQLSAEGRVVPRLALNTDSEDFRDSLDIPEDVELDSERNRPPHDSLELYSQQHLEQAMRDTRWDDPPTPPPGPAHRQGIMEPHRGYGGAQGDRQGYGAPGRQGYANPQREYAEGYVDSHREGYADPQRQGYSNLRGQDPQRQGYGDPQRQGYGDPQRQGYGDPQRQGYVDPQRQGYVDPQRQGYVDPQRQGYVDPQRQGYVDPQRQGYVDPQRQGYGDPQRQGYMNPQQQGYKDPQRQGYGDAQWQGYGDPQRQGYGDPQRQGYGDPQRQGYGDPQRQGYRDPQQQGYGDRQRQEYAGPKRQGYADPEGYGGPQRQGYGEDYEEFEEQAYVDSQRQGFGQGYAHPQRQGYAPIEKQDHPRLQGSQNVDLQRGGHQNRPQRQDHREPPPSYRGDPQMLGYGDFQDEGFLEGQRNGYANPNPPNRYHDSNHRNPPAGNNHITPRADAGQFGGDIPRRQYSNAYHHPQAGSRADYRQNPAPPGSMQQGGYYAQETEPPPQVGQAIPPRHQPFTQEPNPRNFHQQGQGHADRNPPAQQRGYGNASSQEGFYLTELRDHPQDPVPVYRNDFDSSDFGHQSAHAPQPARTDGDDSDRYKDEDAPSQNSTARESIPLPKPENDYIAQNKVSYGRPAKHSYKKLHSIKKEEEEKLNHVFVQPKVKGKSQKGSRNSSPTKYPAIAESPVEDEGQGAEELWAQRSASLARAKMPGGKKKAGSSTSMVSRNTSRLPTANNGASSSAPSTAQAAQRRPAGAQGAAPGAVRALPPQQGSTAQLSPLQHQVALPPVTQQVMTEDGQRISVDVNLRLISPPVGTQIEGGTTPQPAGSHPQGTQRRTGMQYPSENAGFRGQQLYDGAEEYPRGRYSADDVLSSKNLDREIAAAESYLRDGTEDYTGYSTNPYKKIPPIPTSSEAPRSAPVQSEGSYMLSYLREKEKNQKVDKPWYRVYGLQDYKRMQKEIRLGTLGPDLENDQYRERREKMQRQTEYAKSVKNKNTRELITRKPPSFPRPKEQDDMLNKRKLAIEYAKSVPKPAVKPPQPTPFNNYQVASSMSPIARPPKAQQPPPSPPEEPTADVLDLQKLHERHEQDKRNAEIIRQKTQGVTS